jgi:hypothetical protein
MTPRIWVDFARADVYLKRVNVERTDMRIKRVNLERADFRRWVMPFVHHGVPILRPIASRESGNGSFRCRWS